MKSKNPPKAGEDGFYEVKLASIADDLQALAGKSGAQFIVIGSLLSISEGAKICDTIRRKKISSSMVLLLRSVNTASVSQVPTTEKPICVGEIVITPERHEVKIGTRMVELTKTEMRILTLLALNPGVVFPREKIIREINGDGYLCTPRSIDVHMAGMRRKLGDAARQIITVRGVGYKINGARAPGK